MKNECQPCTRIVIVDDHTIVREGVTALLAAETTIKVVGESSDPAAAILLIGRLRPDIVLLDLLLKDKHGLEVLHKIRGKTKVIVLSMRAEELYVAEALHLGAAGYVLKEATSAELLTAIKNVRDGESYLSSSLSAETIQRHLRSFRIGEADRYTTLTARERTILPLAAEGLTSFEIGERLSISARTVEVHRARLMKKLGLKSQTELVRYAARRNLVVL